MIAILVAVVPLALGSFAVGMEKLESNMINPETQSRISHKSVAL